MRIIARHGVELGGHVYRKGEACADYAGEITPRIADNFTDEHGRPLTARDGAEEPDAAAPDAKGLVAKCVETLRRDGIRLALDGMGVAYPPTATTAYLAKLLLVQRGEIAPEDAGRGM